MANLTSKGLVLPEEPEDADIEVINDNMERINDYGMGAFSCTSTTRPSSPWAGLVIFETDTKRTKVWDGSNWLDVFSAFKSDAFDTGFPAAGPINDASTLTYMRTVEIPSKPFAQRVFFDATFHFYGGQDGTLLEVTTYLVESSTQTLDQQLARVRGITSADIVTHKIACQGTLPANTAGKVEVRLRRYNGTGNFVLFTSPASLRRLHVTAIPEVA